MGTGGKWKAAWEERGVHTRVLAVYIKAWTLHADAFRRSRWAHQIRIHVFTLDLKVCICVSLCRSLMMSVAQNMNLVIWGRFHAPPHVKPPAACWWFPLWRPVLGVTYIPHLLLFIYFFGSKQLTRLSSSLQQAEGAPSSLQSKFTGKWNPLYAKQTMRRK